MKKILLLSASLFVMFALYYFTRQESIPPTYSVALTAEPPGIDNEPSSSDPSFFDVLTWKRPEGPLRVGIQAGHWKNSELPDELERIRGNSGTSNKQITEWQANLNIAEEIKKILEPEGIVVDILPATVPPSYLADAFISIHADGNINQNISGYKIAAPRRDLTGKADTLVQLLDTEYGETTKLQKDPNITRNMTGYYAFSWRRFEHAIHPMTPAAIVETGFLTNPSDAKMIANNPKLPAQAVANALIKFLKPANQQ